MRRIGSRELKNRLGRYLREVKRGSSLLITKRGGHLATISQRQAVSEKDETFDELLNHFRPRLSANRGRLESRSFQPSDSVASVVSQSKLERSGDDHSDAMTECLHVIFVQA